jgi:hypothetical protein
MLETDHSRGPEHRPAAPRNRSRMNLASVSRSIMVVTRAALPADTVALARWLIGRIVVRHLPRASSADGSSRPKPTSATTRPRIPIAG